MSAQYNRREGVGMVIKVVQIGNSKGIRIPKAILEQCRIESEVSLEVENGKVVLEPVSSVPRQGWRESFERMHDAGDDELLIQESLDVDLDDWEW